MNSSESDKAARKRWLVWAQRKYTPWTLRCRGLSRTTRAREEHCLHVVSPSERIFDRLSNPAQNRPCDQKVPIDVCDLSNAARTIWGLCIQVARSVVIFCPNTGMLVSILQRPCSRPSNSPAAPRLSSSRRSTLPRYHEMMCSSPMRRKEQKFNSKSAVVTSTLLVTAVFGVLMPAILYQIHGSVRTFLAAMSPLIIAFELRPCSPSSYARHVPSRSLHSLNAETEPRCSLGVYVVPLRPP